MIHPRRALTLVALAAFARLCCASPAAPLSSATPTAARRAVGRDFELEVCRSRIARLRAEPALAGALLDGNHRAAILGRALGEPLLFVRAPAPAAGDEMPPALRRALAVAPKSPGRRAAWLVRRFRGRPALLRQAVLREGYLYTDDPLAARLLVRRLKLRALFEAPRLWLQRGAALAELVRHTAGRRGRDHYRYASGERRGLPAKLLFGDRVALTRRALATPLHRDVRALRDALGFERLQPLHIGAQGLLARLRFGSLWVRALLEADGARLKLGCYDAPAEVRRRITAHQRATAIRRRAIARLRQAAQRMIDERLPFDRPRGVIDHLSDGQLRPQWEQAYRLGHSSFVFDDERYLVFDAAGRPAPPQMCVEMIVDVFERAGGSWYLPAAPGRARIRTTGSIDFRLLGLRNRSGVIAFGDFAEAHPALFDTVHLPAADRVPFARRTRFFRYLLEHAALFAPGDIIAIRGPKPDGYVHQHAILIADVDPLTGFPYALIDQMRWPRRRSFEAIMAEAPRRSLLYRARPTEALLARLIGGAGHD